MSSKSTQVEYQLLINLFDQLIEQQLRTYEGQQKLFYYTDILIQACKKILLICNNSPLALKQFCRYIGDKLISHSLQIPPNPQHILLEKLKVEENYVVYFTQICYRLILLSLLCKLGQQANNKQWRSSLNELFKQARLQFTFNYHDSLATVFVTFLSRTDEICNQFTFYEKLVSMFTKYDLEFVAEDVKQKITKAKQNWKQNVNKNKQQFHSKTENQTNKKIEDSTMTEKLKKARKSVKIVCEPDKLTPAQSLTKRISDFREIQRKRLSEHIQSSKKRTLFYSRKYTMKTTSNSQPDQDQQSIYIQQSQPTQQHHERNSPKPTKVTKDQSFYKIKKQEPKNKELRNNKPTESRLAYDEQNFGGDDEGFFVPGTPPRKKKHNNIQL